MEPAELIEEVRGELKAALAPVIIREVRNERERSLDDRAARVGLKRQTPIILIACVT